MIFSVKSIEYCYLKADLIRRFIIINAYSEDSFCMFHFSASPRNCLAHSYILQRTSTSFDTVLYSCTYSELDVSGTRCCQWLLVHNNLSTLNNRLKEFIVVFYFSVRTKFIYQCTAVFLLKFKVIYSSAISFVHFVFFSLFKYISVLISSCFFFPFVLLFWWLGFRFSRLYYCIAKIFCIPPWTTTILLLPFQREPLRKHCMFQGKTCCIMPWKQLGR